ncbi:hypothetical protein DER45DRAFT_616928 [Fusarium avenaceum]|nr:hypothetical protein DER45DRAFT_616928 [Fusarium avenaceum]
MPLVLFLGVLENGHSRTCPPTWPHDNLHHLISTFLFLLKIWTSGRTNPTQQPLHGKVVMMTGGTSGIGAQAAVGLAKQGAQLVLLTQLLQYPNVCDEVDRQCAAPTIGYDHSLRRSLDAPWWKRRETDEGIEETWMVNFLANFHLLGILSPALRAQPIDRDVRVIIPTCSSYIASPSLKDPVSKANWTPSTAYARSKLALNVFGQAFQKHLDSYDRPDKAPNNTRVVFVDPGLARTPSTRRWLTRGSLWGLAAYLTGYIVPWFLLKSPHMAAQSILYAAMDNEFARGSGGKLIKECMEVDFARKEVKDDDVAKKLWEESDTLIEKVEKIQAKKRAAQKAADEKKAKEETKKEKDAEVEELLEAIKKGKEQQKKNAGKKGKK